MFVIDRRLYHPHFLALFDCQKPDFPRPCYVCVRVHMRYLMNFNEPIFMLASLFCIEASHFSLFRYKPLKSTACVTASKAGKAAAVAVGVTAAVVAAPIVAVSGLAVAAAVHAGKKAKEAKSERAVSDDTPATQSAAKPASTPTVPAATAAPAKSAPAPAAIKPVAAATPAKSVKKDMVVSYSAAPGLQLVAVCTARTVKLSPRPTRSPAHPSAHPSAHSYIQLLHCPPPPPRSKRVPALVVRVSRHRSTACAHWRCVQGGITWRLRFGSASASSIVVVVVPP